MNKYSYIRNMTIPDEFACLHDANVSQIYISKSGLRLVCKDCFTIEKGGEDFSVSQGRVLFKGVKASDCECHVFYGKASSAGEMMFGIPITIKDLNDYLKKTNSTIELFEEYYSDLGEVLLKGELRPYRENLGVNWRHVVIKIMKTSTVKYSGVIQDK